jgi:dolichol kinase
MAAMLSTTTPSMAFPTEIKRKLFHHLSLIYMILYALFPRMISLWFFFIVLVLLGFVEFVRLRRPELNAWFLKKFGGLHRPTEIMAPSGIFWTLLGCWLTMLLFISKAVVIVALGYLAFGDTMAAVCGQAFGTKCWKQNPTKTKEGSIAFALTAVLWALLFIRVFPAIFSAVVTAFTESRRLPFNDNLWIPLSAALSTGLVYGASRARIPVVPLLLAEVLGFALLTMTASYFISKRKVPVA